MTQLPRRYRRSIAAAAALVGALAIGLLAPMPSMPDDGRAAVAAEVSERLPGWKVERLARSWEGAYTVVTSCAGLELDFQYVPGHGLPSDDAWIRPSDAYGRDVLGDVSDHYRYLVWYRDPVHERTLSCAEELARIGDEAISPDRAFD